ncbi:Hypothetical protein R9X50_00495200 [Acrodontium crateriforme]|uniref:Urease accessory protein UreD n=1 Tax=Acrodontium crateriforme TaxID=150365 RepID=A0AAQ3M557_9PEZI|nr:Hypothetical protein R9X50_00495200 [Acrodontium crateriforme]
MPHKHTRKRGADDGDYNLPPTVHAKPLPTFDNTAKNKKKQEDVKRKKDKRKRAKIDGYGEDDTPRAFARMIQQQGSHKRHSGLDNGERRATKKQKTDQTGNSSAPAPPKEAVTEKERREIPKILPGERLADYSARVDQALPVAGLAKKGNKKIEGLKERQTKTEKRLHKMYAQWREDDAKYKERLEEQQELEEEEEEEKQAQYGGQNIQLPQGKRARRKQMVGEATDKDDDPWAILKKRREAPKGLHDVVQAPPTLKAVKEKFKVRNVNGAGVRVANVPTAAGSLKRREELSDARQEVIERYRQMMKNSGA